MIPILATFLALLLIVSTACSGDGDTPTPIPLTTPPQESLAVPTPTKPLMEAAAPDSQSGTEEKESFAESLEIFVTTGETESVSINLKAGDVLRVTYKATPQVMTARTALAAVILTLTDPAGQQLTLAGDDVDERQAIARGTSDTVVELDGEYVLGFSNPLPLIALVVNFEYIVNP